MWQIQFYWPLHFAAHKAALHVRWMWLIVSKIFVSCFWPCTFFLSFCTLSKSQSTHNICCCCLVIFRVLYSVCYFHIHWFPMSLTKSRLFLTKMPTVHIVQVNCLDTENTAVHPKAHHNYCHSILLKICRFVRCVCVVEICWKFSRTFANRSIICW